MPILVLYSNPNTQTHINNSKIVKTWQFLRFFFTHELKVYEGFQVKFFHAKEPVGHSRSPKLDILSNAIFKQTKTPWLPSKMKREWDGVKHDEKLSSWCIVAPKHCVAAELSSLCHVTYSTPSNWHCQSAAHTSSEESDWWPPSSPFDPFQRISTTQIPEVHKERHLEFRSRYS